MSDKTGMGQLFGLGLGSAFGNSGMFGSSQHSSQLANMQQQAYNNSQFNQMAMQGIQNAWGQGVYTNPLAYSAPAYSPPAYEPRASEPLHDIEMAEWDAKFKAAKKRADEGAAELRDAYALAKSNQGETE